jgi:polyvinyl alcohol dehydrogenase (cytochrome)
MKRASFALLAMAATLAPVTGHAEAACTDGSGPSWTMHSKDAENSRNAESSINSSNVGALQLKAEIPTTGVAQNTPLIVNDCIFLATDAAQVAAYTTDGVLVWTKTFEGPFGGYGGSIIGSPLYHDGNLYVALNRASKPTLAIIDVAQGPDSAREVVLDTWRDNFASAAPVLAGDLIFFGISGAEATAHARGAYALVELDGTPIDLRPEDDSTYAQYVINDAEYAQGYRGASLWSTGAYHDGFVYVGGGNPASKQLEHRYSNALIKIDVRRNSPTFGKIVDGYKGDTDHYYPGLERQPVCELYPTSIVWSPTCVQLDLDFGASPNVWINEEGKAIVGAAQKSGVFHAAYADTMTRAWTTVIGAPGVAFNAATASVDGDSVFVVGTPGGQMFGMEGFDGQYEWVFPVADGAHFGPTTVTNDVVFTVTTTGFLLGVNADTGAPVFAGRRSDNRGTGNTSAGAAVVGDLVVAPVGNQILVFGL